MTLKEAREYIGGAVIYLKAKNDNERIGYITSVNDTYVFVRFSFSLTSQAVRPEDLKI